ncbi:MAG: META domain-containing protein [Pseudomonadota bacterium]|nr:META domain-containing protein [Pseudomonadota bacterium]
MKQRTKDFLLTAAGIITLFSTAAHAVQPTSAELKNASYTGIYEHTVTLKDGRWEGEPFVSGGASRPSVGLVEDSQLSGDLNGDGLPEQAVILWESAGGSGTRTYLTVMSNIDDKLVNLGTALIGDRVQFQAGRIKDGRVELDVIQTGPGEPACCPSQKATRTWSLDGKDLKEGESVVTGKLSLADLEGVEWVLTHIYRNKELPAKPEVTLRFDGKKIAGKSACNNYFAEVKESADMAGDISIGPIGTTKMACPQEIMPLEQRYFKALQGTNKFSFLAGKLALNWQQGEKLGTMLFVSRAMPSNKN